jgi:hypothetical protein
MMSLPKLGYSFFLVCGLLANSVKANEEEEIPSLEMLSFLSDFAEQEKWQDPFDIAQMIASPDDGVLHRNEIDDE